MRTFDTGATRDTDQGKFDYEGFLSPLVIERFGQYMNEHRVQPDGSLRDSDNWQKGMPLDAYMKSGWRHFVDVWKGHRGIIGRELLIEALCALLFNVQGYLHELLKQASDEREATPIEEQPKGYLHELIERSRVSPAATAIEKPQRWLPGRPLTRNHGDDL